MMAGIDAKEVAAHGLSMARFYWVARRLADGVSPAEIVELDRGRVTLDQVEWVADGWVLKDAGNDGPGDD